MNTLRKLILILGLFLSSFAYAGSGITYHGRLLRSDSSAVEGQFVGFRFKILAGDSNACEMYQETQTKDMRNSKGAFAIVFGDGSVVGTYNVSSLSFFSELFENNRTFNFSAPAGCAASPYTPATREGRKILVEFRESPTDPWEALPIVNLGYVPFAYNSVIADKALQVGSHTTASLLRVENSGTPQSISALTPTQYTTLASILGGSYVSSVTATAGQTTVSTVANVATVGLADVSGLTAGTYGSATQVPVFTVDAKGRITSVTNTAITGGGGGGITALTGDVTASGSGSVAATIANSAVTTAKIADANVTNVKMATDSVATANIVDANVTLAKLAGDSVNSSKIVDGSITGSDISSTAALSIASVAATGNVGANTMSTGAMALYELPANGTNYLQLQAANNMAANYSLVFPATDGSANQVLTTDGSGNLSWSTPTSTPANASYTTKGIVQFDTDAATSGITVAAGVAKLANSGVTAATYGAAATVPVLTVDAFGRVTTVTDTAIAINASAVTAGILPIARGGTNSGTALNSDRIMISNGGAIVEAPAMTDGQLLIGATGSNPKVASLTAGSGVTITPSAGGITIAASGTGGTVTGVTGSAPISVTASSTTPNVSISQANTTTDGYLSSTDWNTFNNKQTATLTNGNIWVGNGSNVATSVTMAGDVTLSSTGSATISSGAVSYAKIQNVGAGKILGNSTGGAATAEEVSIGTGLSLAAGTLSATGSDTFAGLPCGNGYLPYRSAGAWTCIQAASANTASTLVQRDASGNFTAGAGTFNTSVVLADGAAGGQLTLSAPTAFTSYSLKFPSADGSANQVLKTDGSGNLGWSTALTNSTGYVNGGNAFGADATIGLTDAYRLDFLTNNAARMTIDSAGKVGIGTTSPQAALDVGSGNIVTTGKITYPGASVGLTFDSSGRPTFTSTSAGAVWAILKNTVGASGSSVFLRMDLGSVQSGEISSSYQSAGNMDMAFSTRGSNSMSERMRIVASGKVGIGTSSPTTKLEVNGSVLVGDGGETCSGGSYAGAIRYNGGNLQFCDGSSWNSLGIAGAGITALTGDVTASGSGSVAATIANDAVTFAKFQNITDNRLLGRSAGSNGDMQEISIGTGLSLAAGTLSATGSDTFAGLPCGNGYLPYRSAGAWTCIQSTSTNTASTLVERDSSGNFTAGAGTFNTSIKLTDGAAGGQLTLSAPVAFTSYSLKFPSADGSANQVLKTDGAGNLGWVTAATAATAYMNGGNGFGANATLGLTDAFRLDFLTNNSARMSIDSSGNVGIGTTSPSSILDINGAQTFREIASASAPAVAAGKSFVYADNSSHTLKASLNGAAYEDVATVSSNISGTASNVTGTVLVANGGTGATTVSQARVNIGVYSYVTFITSGATWTSPASTTGFSSNSTCKFTLIGGGGGSGGVAATAALKSSGGGAGGVCVHFATGLTANTAYAIAVGAAGAAGDNSPSAGGNGGDTTLTIGATTYTASGGSGSQAASAANKNGGVGGGTTNCSTAPDFSITGQAGGATSSANNANGSGSGGNTGLGFGLGGAGLNGGGSQAGLAGTGYGGGGGGSSAGSGGTAQAGAAGAQGAIMVECWN